jgi:flagellar motor protein MotB
MMAFFLVMWLMGSDEETKQAIAHYFNDPTTPWKAGKDPKSQTNQPMGEAMGPGESLLNGREGRLPEDLIQRPSYQVPPELQANQELAETIAQQLPGKVFAFDIEVDSLRFSIAQDQVFKAGTLELTDNGVRILEKIGKLIRSYAGYTQIVGHTDEDRMKGGPASTFEVSLSRAVAVMRHLIKNKFLEEERVTPQGTGDRKPLATEEVEGEPRRNRRIEFILTKNKS